MRALVASLLAASLAFASSSARAYEGPDSDPDPAPEPEPAAGAPAHSRPTHWYGYQTLGTDAAAIALLVPALVTNVPQGEQSGFALASSLTYGFGGPIVHWSHGAIGKGFGDLALRVGAPIALGFVGGIIGAAAYHPAPCGPAGAQDWCGLGQGLGELGAELEGMTLGGLVGIAGAITLDAAVLAREPATRDSDDATDAHPRELLPSSPASPVAHVEPAFGVSPERQGGTRATFGLRGVF